MPRFKNSNNLFTPEEFFDENWFDTPFLQLPPNKKWDYKKELQIEDVSVWEIIWEGSGGVGVYAAWEPYAEFYLIKMGWNNAILGYGIETFYGKNASENVFNRLKELGLTLNKQKVWVDSEDMWLYS